MAPHDCVPPAIHLVSLCVALVAMASILVVPGYSSASPGENTEQVLGKIREATGYRALEAEAGGVLVEGLANYRGLRGPFALLFDAKGRFIQKIHLRWEETVAFDGTTAWGVDWSATPRVLQLNDLETAQTEMWVRTGRWLAPNGPFQIAIHEGSGNASELQLHLKLKHGIRQMDLFVDRSSWLPTRLTARHLGATETWEFGDYRAELGVTLPHRTIHRFGGASDTYEIHTVRPALAAKDDPFRPVLDRPRDFEFRSAGPQRFEVKQGAGGHLFVRPKVNGVDVGWFALDTGTGAGMTISAAVADRLGMSTFGQVVQGGAGKLGLGKLHQGKTFELGSITIHNSIYVELPQAFCDAMKKLFDLDLVGTCGYDLFSRAVVELDLKELTASCHEPTGYTLASGNWQELLLNRKISCVHATFEARQGLFQFDTGAGSNIAFHARAVDQFRLLEHRQTTPIKVGGVGGIMDARYGPLEWFEVGSKRLQHPTAIFLAPHEGALDDPYVAGTFGAGILKGMKIVFDYPHRRIAFGGSGS